MREKVLLRVRAPLTNAAAMNKYLVEFLGTFFLFLVISLSTRVVDAPLLAPVAIGFALAVMVYAGGRISGGHYNPAVTLAAAIRGAMPYAQILPYWIAQVAGAVAAAFAAFALVGPEGITVLQLEPGKIFLAEIIFTTALAYVVLNVATGKKAEGNSYFGLAIGATVMVGALSVGPISGGAFNPAVAIAACVSGLFVWSQLWIYIVGCLAGGVIAALLFKAVSPEGE
jgi:aquaporin Z